MHSACGPGSIPVVQDNQVIFRKRLGTELPEIPHKEMPGSGMMT